MAITGDGDLPLGPGFGAGRSETFVWGVVLLADAAEEENQQGGGDDD